LIRQLCPPGTEIGPSFLETGNPNSPPAPLGQLAEGAGIGHPGFLEIPHFWSLDDAVVESQHGTLQKIVFLERILLADDSHQFWTNNCEILPFWVLGLA
jgi:hypothetical protein